MYIIKQVESENHSPKIQSSLTSDHQRMLEESIISEAVAIERGYRSVETKSALKELGFAESQRRTPALLIPIHGVSGEIINYQIRPDDPRVNKKGKAIKYETVADSKMCIDVPSRILKEIRDPNKPLFITEGVKKADSAVSKGICCIALIGVWNWRGTNEWGGKTALPDWESIALNGRKVYIVFDSDVVEKESVQMALSRLKSFLASRGADVFIIYLPSGADGSKIGLDDFFAAGNTVTDLMTYASKELRNDDYQLNEQVEYEQTPNGIVWNKYTQNGIIPVSLCNFSAQIEKEVIEDDGEVKRRFYEVQAVVGTQNQTIEIPAVQFHSLNWLTDKLGSRAVIFPGQGERTRVAIQLLSKDVQQHHVYTHTGWRKIGEDNVYLHANGAIGKDGLISDVEVRLASDMSEFKLHTPPAGEELREAVAASLSLLKVAPIRLMLPLIAAVCRSILSACDFSLFLVGQTGTGKSCLAALLQQFFGAGFDLHHLPASWASTENALEAQAFTYKDAIMVIDDYAPPAGDRILFNRKAERVLRAQGNNSGRQRLTRDTTTLRPTKMPRGLILSTGEDIPDMQSLRSRMLILEVEPNSVDFNKLSVAQDYGTKGVFAKVMSAYIQWLAKDYDQIMKAMPEALHNYRQAASKDLSHRRTPEIVANLALGLEIFTDFATAMNAMTSEQEKELREVGWKVLGEVATDQKKYQLSSDPVQIFTERLQSILSTGRAHIACVSGGMPQSNAALLGWKGIDPQGRRIGWSDGQRYVYLEFDSAFAEIQKLSSEINDQIPISGNTLVKRLNERGFLASSDIHTGRRSYRIRRKINGSEKTVVHLHFERLFPPIHQESDNSDDFSLNY